MVKLLFRFLARHISREYLISFYPAFKPILTVSYKGNKFCCPICERSFRKFLPWGTKGQDNRLCPNCLSLERHRLLWLYLKNKTDFFTAKLKVLHVAPATPFVKRFKAMKNIDYTTADLFSRKVDVRLNIEKIPCSNNSFDVIICNHVLEHVEKERQAISELFRILKKGGWAILQVPINIKRKETLESVGVLAPQKKESYFGQRDHLRIHGLDYPQILEEMGFSVYPQDYFQELGDEPIRYYRLPKKRIIYLNKKGKDK